MEDGLIKKVSESYLVDAMSFTEAEARIIEKRQPYVSGEMDVTAIKRTRYSEIVGNLEADKWFKAKLNFITIDEVTAKEKKTAVYLIVGAESIDDARIKVDESMKGSMADYETVTLDETRILEVYPYEAKEEK